jgi:pimeloyl-ACP methyl ester carboxylesterase
MTTQPNERFCRVNDVELCYETFGDRSDPALLLIMGLATQMIAWDTAFCRLLAEHGFFVIRFDNRDCGRSTSITGSERIRRRQLLRRNGATPPYRLEDMADDTAGLLDQLGIEAAHVTGASMGGMVAQLLAIRHPERVLSLVSMMSTTGNPRVGRPSPRLIPILLRRLPRDRDAYIRAFKRTARAIGSPRFPGAAEQLRALAEASFERGINPPGTARQLAAILAARDRTEELRRLRIPACVIHGQADRLVNPSGGRATAAAIPGAELVIIEGMGHDLPPEVWPRLVEAIVSTARHASRMSRPAPVG